MLSIQKAGINDIPIIRQLSLAIWPPTYLAILGEAQVAYMLDLFYSSPSLEKQMGAGHEFIICSDDGEPIAFAAWSEVEPRIYKLHKIYALSDRQRKGVGAFMLKYI